MFTALTIQVDEIYVFTRFLRFPPTWTEKLEISEPKCQPKILVKLRQVKIMFMLVLQPQGKGGVIYFYLRKKLALSSVSASSLVGT